MRNIHIQLVINVEDRKTLYALMDIVSMGIGNVVDVICENLPLSSPTARKSKRPRSGLSHLRWRFPQPRQSKIGSRPLRGRLSEAGWTLPPQAGSEIPKPSTKAQAQRHFVPSEVENFLCEKNLHSLFIFLDMPSCNN